MAQVDLAGAVLPSRIAKGRIATVAVNQFIFKQPVSIGDLLSFYAKVERVGQTSITVRVEVYAERNPADLTPEYARNQARSIKPEFFVGVGICSHLGCSPSDKFQEGAQPSLPDDWVGGFLCPCHGSTFDMAGRVFKNKPAPDNLEVPPHMYLSDSRLIIGEDKKA